MAGYSFETHNHERCIASAIAAAEAVCDSKKLKFTKARRRVLEILLAEHKAMGAYDILGRLKAEGLGSQPPIAYRALDFLVSNGFAHKVEKLNAYVACAHPGQVHTPAFMICRACDAVAETHSTPGAGILGPAARRIGFEIETAVIEAEGLCPSCRKSVA